jgi:hypothetical protein
MEINRGSDLPDFAGRTLPGVGFDWNETNLLAGGAKHHCFPAAKGQAAIKGFSVSKNTEWSRVAHTRTTFSATSASALPNGAVYQSANPGAVAGKATKLL